MAGDGGKPVVLDAPDSAVAQAFRQIAGNVAAQVSVANLNNPNTMIIE